MKPKFVTKRIAKRVAQLKLRKGIPPDDVPIEILRLVFCATPGVAKSSGRGAVGSNGVVAGSDDLKIHARGMRILRQMWIEHLASMSASRRLPWQHNLNHAWFLCKNKKEGPAFLRNIFGVLSIAKILIPVLFERALPKKDIVVPDFVFHVSGRRLEEAIAIQLVNGFRLADSSLVSLRSFRDTANASLSISHDAAPDPLEPISDPRLHGPLIDQI